MVFGHLGNSLDTVRSHQMNCGENVSLHARIIMFNHCNTFQVIVMKLRPQYPWVMEFLIRGRSKHK